MAMRSAACRAGGTGRLLTIKVLGPHELGAATMLLTEGMRENPLHAKVFGADMEQRQRRLQRFIGLLVTHVYSNGTLLGARFDGELIGVLGMVMPGRCRPGWRETLRMVGAIIASNPLLGVWRIVRWLSAWARNDPFEPHAHIGPLAVAPAWRRRDAGRTLMTRCCQCVDADRAVAWLETDRAVNVAFYETLGFVVVRREPVLGVPNWFMRRGARRTSA